MYIPEIPDCSIKPLLEEIIYIASKTKDIDWHHTSFNKSASEAEIISLENELDLKIPAEYRDLLKFSNGFEFFGVSSDFLGLSGIRTYNTGIADGFLSDYVTVGLLAGDGERLCFSKESGKFLRWFDGEEKWFDNFYDVLNDIVSDIREFAEDYVDL